MFQHQNAIFRGVQSVEGVVRCRDENGNKKENKRGRLARPMKTRLRERPARLTFRISRRPQFGQFWFIYLRLDEVIKDETRKA